MRWFIGGQQALMPELLAMVASTVNSYTRLMPGFWAPTDATWGIENRTCALRVDPGLARNRSASSTAIAAADINPYIALAAAIGSGLWGIENRIEPDKPIEGNAYAQTYPKKRQLPRTLWDAAQRLKGSKAARDSVRRCFRRPLCRHPRMGRARVPQGHHRLGDGAIFRDHLKRRMTRKSLPPHCHFFRKSALLQHHGGRGNQHQIRDLHLVFGSRLTAGPAAANLSQARRLTLVTIWARPLDRLG